MLFQSGGGLTPPPPHEQYVSCLPAVAALLFARTPVRSRRLRSVKTARGCFTFTGRRQPEQRVEKTISMPVCALRRAQVASSGVLLTAQPEDPAAPLLIRGDCQKNAGDAFEVEAAAQATQLVTPKCSRPRATHKPAGSER